ncbi:MAG: nicotinamide riboside transporter PnuC [Bacteroidota bacterium]
MNVTDFLFSAYYETATGDIVLEIIAVIFGIASVLFAQRENIWVYPTGLISTGIYVYLLYKVGLFGDMGINAYYFAMSIYGWVNWLRPQSDTDSAGLSITRATTRDHLIGLGIFVPAFLSLVYLLSHYTSSTVPWIDGFTTTIFFIGMWYMAQKKVVNWVYWIIGDLISIPLYFYKGLPLSSLQFIIFTGMAIFGYLEWKKRLAAQDANQALQQTRATPPLES